MTDRRVPTSQERAAGQVLKSIRQEKGLTATAIAYRLGMSEQNVLRYENGRNQLSFLQIRDFAWALEVGPDDLYQRLRPLLNEPDKRPIPTFNPWLPARTLVDREPVALGV